ncbi:unnamed protein product [Lasius platythorax]|uniref:DUF4806 domain-containing protein n=1 Tax=Lasius platythorax TaxID=488582 RepID=A0AAV2MW15_9HYME
MEWIIVKFLDEDEVEAVPLKWITADRKYCYFPSLKENIKQAIKDCLDIKPNWQKYKIDIISRKSYTKFATATAKASKACFVSDLSEYENENLSTKRQSIKNTFYGYTDTESSETERETSSPHEIPVHPDINNFNEIDIATCPIIIEGQLEQQMLRYLISNNKILKELREEIYQFQEKLNDIINQISNTDTIIDNKIMEKLPLSTLEELDIYENELRNENSIKKLATGLARLGGSNYKECTRRIMSKVMTDELESHFSYKGHKSKKNFSKLQISIAVLAFFLVLDTVKIYDKKETSIKEMESVIAIWLSKTPERLKKKE